MMNKEIEDMGNEELLQEREILYNNLTKRLDSADPFCVELSKLLNIEYQITKNHFEDELNE